MLIFLNIFYSILIVSKGSGMRHVYSTAAILYVKSIHIYFVVCPFGIRKSYTEH